MLGALFHKIARGEILSKAEASRLKQLGDNLERLEYLVRGWTSAGEATPNFDQFLAAFGKVVMLSMVEGRIPKVDYNPAYREDECIIYFYSDGAGADELRARGKIGATETQVMIGNITP